VKVRWIKAGDGIGARRGEMVACIPVYGGHEVLVKCLESVFAHTPASVSIMIFDDASPDERSQEHVRGLQGVADDRELFYLRRERNIGFPANMNGAFAAAAPADVVVLNSDCVVAEGWLESLRAAAYESSRVATATALTNHGSIVSVPDLRRPRPALPEPWSFDDAAAAVRLRSRRIRPRIPTAVGHCMYVRRTALELVGDFDLAFTPGYGEEVDFSQRCLLSGLCHVLADDVLVLHHGSGSFALNGDRNLVQEAHERIIAARYPYYHDGLRSLEQTAGPLSRALNVARRALTGLTVTVDLRDAHDDGPDQDSILALLNALAGTDGVRLAALVSDRRHLDFASALADIEGLTVRHEADIDRTGERADIVHRLHSVPSIEQMRQLASLGERVVLTLANLCGYQNPSYFQDFQAWEAHRALTRQVTGLADRVVFFSESARADALAEGLVPPSRARTVRAGVDHDAGLRAVAKPPGSARQLSGEVETILCLEPSFRHTNRIFALRLLEQLQLRHQWEGRLLLVGREVSHGSSFPQEQRCMAVNPRLAQATVIWPAVERAERAWLLRHCRLVLHFPIGQGLELVPFEAASHGVPCLWAPGTWLGELIGEEHAPVVPWDAQASADCAFGLLREPDRRAQNLAATRRVASSLTWKATAEALLEVYDDAHGTSSVRAMATAPAPQRELAAWSEDAVRLVGPGGALPGEATRVLLALSTHPVLGVPVFRTLELGYRAYRRVRRSR
jgi:GT2 family glycosyltransferase